MVTHMIMIYIVHLLKILSSLDIVIEIRVETWVIKKKKSPSLCFFKRNAAFTWTSKKQPIVTLLNCEAEFVSTTSFVCHIIWSKNLLKDFNLSLEDQHNYGNISRYLISYP